MNRHPWILAFFLCILVSLDASAQCSRPEGGAKEIALFDAIQNHISKRVLELLHDGANPNVADRNGHTLLMCAGISDRNADIVRSLIAAGAKVNACLGSNVSVLMYVCGDYQNQKIIDILIKAGADLNARSNDGGTALMDAALWGNLDAVKLLIAAGADINTADDNRSTAIDFAKDARTNSKEIIDLLVKAGANPYGSQAPVMNRIAGETAPRTLDDLLLRATFTCSQISRFFELRRGSSGRHKKGKNYNDSLQDANQYLRLYLLANLPKIPTSVNAELVPVENFSVKTSQDRKVRTWDWNTLTGGSCPTIYELIEYHTPSGVRCYDPIGIPFQDDMHNHWFDTIGSIKKKNGTTVYLLLESYKADGRNWGQSVTAMAIADTGLVTKVGIFHSPEGSTGQIDYHGPDPTIYQNCKRIEFGADGNSIFIPMLGPNDDPTSEYYRYDFNGEQFILQDGTMKRK